MHDIASTASHISFSASDYNSGYFCTDCKSCFNFNKGLVGSGPLGRVKNRCDKGRDYDRWEHEHNKHSHLGTRGGNHHHNSSHDRSPPHKQISHDFSAHRSPRKSLRYDTHNHSSSSRAHSKSTASLNTQAKSSSSQKVSSSLTISV